MSDFLSVGLEVISKGGPTTVLLLVLYSLLKGWLRTKQEVDQLRASLEREQSINDRVLPAIEKLTTAFEQLTDTIKLVLQSKG